MDIREEGRAAGKPSTNPIKGEPLKEPSLKDLMLRLNNNLEYGGKVKETQEITKKWKWPFKWKRLMGGAQKSIDKVLVFYLNIKGELEQPTIQPLYSGNMIIIRHKPYEVDPRAFWTVKIGLKQYKILIIKEIDRRPVSNLDYTEIKRRGDATDSDEFLIKAALKAQTSAISGKTMKTAIIIIIIAIVAIAIYYFIKG
jgi:hypothetical protein